MQRTAAHCFIESDDTAQTLRLALTDRRLTKLAAQIHTGGLREAAAFYVGRPSPPLLVIETVETDPAALSAAVDGLAEVCAPDTGLILLGSVNDVEMFRQLTRRGVADYLVRPFTAAQLAQALLDAASGPQAAQAGKTVAFIAAKGGAGASTLAHHVAWALSRADDVDAALVDLDLPFGAADLFLNLEPAGGVRNLLSEPDRIDGPLLARFAAKYDERLALFAAPASLDVASAMDAARLEALLDAVCDHYKCVALDLPRVWGGACQTVLRRADLVMIAATADLPSLRNARNLIDWLADARPGAAPPLLALTGVGRGGQLSAEDFAQNLGLAPAAVIPWDGEAFRLAAAAGQTVFEASPKSKAAAALRTLADAVALRVLPRRAEPSRPAGIAARLLSLVKRK
jgi:pilus assembly protein CpaE